MSQGYIVEVTNAPEVVPDVYRVALAEAFNLPPQKADQLIKRLPGVVTKPVSKNEAEMVAGHFRRAGLNAVVRSTEDNLEPSIFERERLLASATASNEVTATLSPTPDLATPRLPYLDDEDELFNTDANDVTPVTTAETTTPEPIPPEPLASNEPDKQTAAGSFLDGTALSKALDKTLNTHTKPVDDRFKVDLTLLETSPSLTNARTDATEETPAATSDATSPAANTKVQRQLLNSALTPVLLTVLGSLAVVWFLVRPVLQTNLINAAIDALSLTASSLNLVASTDGNVDNALAMALEDTLQFQNEAIQLVLLTDEMGQVVSSWLADTAPIETLGQVEKVLPDLSAASQPRTLTTAGGEQLHVMHRDLIQNSDTVGQLVMAVSDRSVTEQVLRLLAYVGLFSLLPLALAFALTLFGVRPLLKRLRYLTERAEAISRGDFGDTVMQDNQDELGQLAVALERLRISMEEALTRLRQRR